MLQYYFEPLNKQIIQHPWMKIKNNKLKIVFNRNNGYRHVKIIVENKLKNIF